MSCEIRSWRVTRTWTNVRAERATDAIEAAKPGEHDSTLAEVHGRRTSYLSPPDFHRLNWACQPVRQAYPFCVYLVGSVMTRPDFRDIDIRIILKDKRYAKMGLEHRAVKLLLDVALSDLVARSAGLSWPIDLQFQSMAEANGEFGDKPRNPLGMPR